jgi:SAM-dependent methyltransferase
VNSWESEAKNWIKWARSPGHDSYWFYSPGFFDELLPSAGRSTLDIGCGEGRVARDLKDRGHSVIAVDSSPTLLRAAGAADSQSLYILGDATRLPLRSKSVDLVVAYNSLIDIDDMPRAVSEAARVLEIGGRICICITHPLNDHGEFAGDDPDAPFVIAKSYYDRHPISLRFERAGLEMTFHSYVRPFEDYARALETAGLLIELVREPTASDEALEHWGEGHAGERRRRIPIFLYIRAVKA